MVYASYTHRMVFDYRDGDVYACVADVGWITGHSYVVYGPLCNGECCFKQTCDRIEMDGISNICIARWTRLIWY